MKINNYTRFFALVLLILSAVFFTSAVSYASNNTAGINNGMVVYYFHGNQRCTTCMNIEKLSEASVEAQFAKEIRDGTVKFISVNVDEDKNEHFIDDYQLLMRSVVIAKIENGKETDWRRLDKVWQLNSDPEAFMNYFDTEFALLLKGKK